MKGKNLTICLYGNPILRKKTTSIKKIDYQLKKIIADLKETMMQQDGLGLAANQIDASVSIFCYNPHGVGIEQEPVAIINPEIIKSEGKEEREEACLSLPGIVEVLMRPARVVIKGISEDGKKIETTASGLLARVFQHEIDHLNGLFFTDRLSATRQKMLKKQLDQIAASSKKTKE
ncbi:MAG: peptide deformylase [Candidatus Latescibacteria bacterium]|nr:peptide deformylase [Candidatus Latescibacterota bacterium]